MKIKTFTRKEFTTPLKGKCIFAGENDYISLCEWANSEGVDVYVSTKNEDKHISLTWGELEALKELYKYANKN